MEMDDHYLGKKENHIVVQSDVFCKFTECAVEVDAWWLSENFLILGKPTVNLLLILYQLQ